MTAIFPMESVNSEASALKPLPDPNKKYTSAATQRRRDIKLKQTDDQLKTLEDQLMRLKKLSVKTPQEIQIAAEKGRSLASQFTFLKRTIDDKAGSADTKCIRDIPSVFKRLACGRGSADLPKKEFAHQQKKHGSDDYEEARAKLNGLVRSYNEWASHLKEAAQEYGPAALGISPRNVQSKQYIKDMMDPKPMLLSPKLQKSALEFNSYLMQSPGQNLNVAQNNYNYIEDEFLGNEDEEIIECHRHMSDPYIIDVFQHSRSDSSAMDINYQIEHVDGGMGYVIPKIAAQNQVAMASTSSNEISNMVMKGIFAYKNIESVLSLDESCTGPEQWRYGTDSFESNLVEMDMTDLDAAENNVMTVASSCNDIQSEIEVLEELLKEEPEVLMRQSSLRGHSDSHSQAPDLVAILQNIAGGNIEETRLDSRLQTFIQAHDQSKEQNTVLQATLRANAVAEDHGVKNNIDTDDVANSAVESMLKSIRDNRIENCVFSNPEPMPSSLGYDGTVVEAGHDDIVDHDEARCKDNSSTHDCAMEKSTGSDKPSSLIHDIGRKLTQRPSLSAFAEMDQGKDHRQADTKDSNMEQCVDEEEEQSNGLRHDADQTALMQDECPKNREEEAASIVCMVQQIEMDTKEVEDTIDGHDPISKEEEIAACNIHDSAKELPSDVLFQEVVAIHGEHKLLQSLPEQKEELGTSPKAENGRIQSVKIDLQKGGEYKHCNVEEGKSSDEEEIHLAADGRDEEKIEDDDSDPRASQDAHQQENIDEERASGVTEGDFLSTGKRKEEGKEIFLGPMDIHAKALDCQENTHEDEDFDMQQRLNGCRTDESIFDEVSKECTEAVQNTETSNNAGVQIEEKQLEHEANEIKHSNKQSQCSVKDGSPRIRITNNCKESQLEATSTPGMDDQQPQKSVQSASFPPVEDAQRNSTPLPSSSFTDLTSPEVSGANSLLTMTQPMYTEDLMVEALMQKIQEMETLQQPMMESLRQKVRNMEQQQQLFVERYLEESKGCDEKRQKLKKKAGKHWIFVLLQACLLVAGMLLAFCSDDSSIPPT